MSEAANYSAFEQLRNGRRVEIRALRPADRADLIAAVDRTSVQSLYRRFFGVRRGFTDQEVASFLNVEKPARCPTPAVSAGTWRALRALVHLACVPLPRRRT